VWLGVCQENAGLREQLDDAQGQLLSRHVEEGQQLLMKNSFHRDTSLLNLTHDQVLTYLLSVSHHLRPSLYRCLFTDGDENEENIFGFLLTRLELK